MSLVRVSQPDSMTELPRQAVQAARDCHFCFERHMTRFGFSAGRIYGLLASSCVLVVLLLETVTPRSILIGNIAKRYWRFS